MRQISAFGFLLLEKLSYRYLCVRAPEFECFYSLTMIGLKTVTMP